jgi:hypothetical protein
MPIKVVEKNPSGRNSIEAIKRNIRNGAVRTDDMSMAFREIVPEIQDLLRYTFSDANASDWQPLKDSYRNWKIKHGYPATIGIRTGDLKKSVSDAAKVEIGKQKMRYSYNTSIGSVENYAGYFNKRRPIMDYARERIDDIATRAVNQEIAEAFK